MKRTVRVEPIVVLRPINVENLILLCEESVLLIGLIDLLVNFLVY